MNKIEFDTESIKVFKLSTLDMTTYSNIEETNRLDPRIIYFSIASLPVINVILVLFLIIIML